jgi:glycosyltransferase involved in cell wall biosynthesis
MRVIVATEHHFFRSPDGNVYPHSVCDYAFWSRYLGVFDEVVVFARVKQVEKSPDQVALASGSGVGFLAAPDFLGAWQYIKQRNRLVSLAAQALGPGDACILRAPGQMSTLLWRQVVKAGRPYGVEVVGDPWESLAPRGVKGLWRPIARVKARRELKHQCRNACAASYVTREKLQQRYPTPAWSCHYSSIDLPDTAIADETQIGTRIKRIDATHRSHGTWRICYVGTMAQLYKAPDVLINAVADCINEGTKLELVMLGDGKFRLRLEDQVRAAGIAEYVRFLGQLPAGQAVCAQLDQTDLFVLPSRTEGLPRSVIEAMARGLPCITSNVGGLPELMEPQYMVPPNDVGALSDRIALVLSKPDLMIRAVRRNAASAREYRSEVLQKRRNEFYTRVKEATAAWSAMQK